MFHRTSRGKGRGTRKGKNKDAGNTSVANVNVQSNPSLNLRGEVDLSVYKDFFRELDIEVFVAMSCTLVMDKKAVKVR